MTPRYEITDRDELISIKLPDGTTTEICAAEGGGDYLEDVVIGVIRQLRAELAAAVAERDELRSYRAEWEPTWDDCEDALVGEQARDGFGHGESIADCARRVLRERDQLRWTLIGIGRALIEQIGATGPEDAVDTVRRACGVIESMASRLAAIDAAPTVAIAVHTHTDRGPYKYLGYSELNVPREGVELIARPAKE
jgi:hypothetical protein